MSLTRFLIGCLLFGMSMPAFAQNTNASVDLAEEADFHFELAVKAYSKGNYESALEHWLVSNRLVPNRNVAFNIAHCYERLGQYSEAYRHYHDVWLSETDPEAKASAYEAQTRIGKHVALVEIETDPPGAQIFVDREDLGMRAISPQILALPEGKHTIIVKHFGYQTAQQSDVVLKSGKTEKTSFKLDRIVGRVSLGGYPQGAFIFVDDKPEPIGTLPSTFELEPGTHIIQVQAEGYQSDRFPVHVRAKQTTETSTNLTMLTGSLVVECDTQGALIEVDGVVKGFAPAVLNDVPVGVHRLRVSRQGLRPEEMNFKIDHDKEQRVKVELWPLNEVTSASRVSEAVDEAPASVTLISEHEIRAFGYETMYDALLGIRGVFSNDDRTYRSFGLRGFATMGDYGNRVLVFLDGHVMNDDQLGSSYADRDLLGSLGDILRIELVRGPGSALYGSNAFFGVINLVTKKEVRPHFEIATADMRQARVRLGFGHQLGNDGEFWITADAFESAGDTVRLMNYQEPTSDGILSYNPVIYGADGARGVHASAKLRLGKFELQADYNQRFKEIPTGAFDTILGGASVYDYRGFVEARYTWNFAENHALLTRLYLDLYLFRGVYPYERFYSEDEGREVGGTLYDNWDGLWGGHEFRLQGSFFNRKFLYSVGMEEQGHIWADLKSRYELDGTFLDVSSNPRVIGAFAVADFKPFSFLTFNIGVRADHMNSINQTMSPRTALVLTPTNGDVIKFVLGQSFRSPSPYELYYHDKGMTQEPAEKLKAEKVETVELEYSHKLPFELQLTMSTFYNHLSNLISLKEFGEFNVLQYTNESQNVSTLGAEVELSHDWHRGYFVSATASVQRMRLGGLGDGERLPNSPAFLASLKAALPVGNTGLTIANRIRMEGPRLTRDNEETRIDYLWDITLTGQTSDERLQYGFGIRNLLDWQAEHASGVNLRFTRVPQIGRTFWASIRGQL